MSWLFEGRWQVYVVLSAATLFCLFMWWRTRQRKWVIGVGAAALLAGLVWLLDSLVVTDREQIQSSIRTLADSVSDRGRLRKALEENLASNFRYRTMNKPEFIKFAEDNARRFGLEAVTVWGFEFQELTETTATVLFMARPDGPWEYAVPSPCKAWFVKEGGKWRMRELKVYRGFVNTNQELDFPP
jgi:hypothetical protein